jgi:translocation and assembly module TamB
VFTGGPITNPGIDVLAVRRPQDVTVGVNVRGTLREPEMRLYSDPSMPQAEQLSWLVFGTPLGRAAGSERALLDRTRDTAQLAGGDLVVRELGRRSGLSEVGIERGDAIAEAALVIGHYLSPRLYVGYGIGIFENPANSIRLRYIIDRNWSFEAETGERATSADIRFTIER